ncbi:MAG: hypothetical protein AB1416_00595 [Actinomycetota bacterium]
MTSAARRRARPRALATLLLAVAALAAAATALAIVPTGDKVRVSDMGPDGDVNFGPSPISPNTAIAYNSTADEYLVVWLSDDTPLEGDTEVYGRRLTAAGAPAAARFRISDVDGTATFGASRDHRPAVAYNAMADEYLVVWTGDETTDGEFEIIGHRVSAAGAPIGVDTRLSQMGTDGQTNARAIMPTVAHNSSSNEYLVAWAGDDSSTAGVDAFDIYVQRVNPGGMELGGDVRISDMGDATNLFNALDPSVAYNTVAREYLVAWSGDDTVPGQSDEEIFVQRLNASAGQIGTDDQRISQLGPDGNTSFDADDPSVAYNPTANEYLVAFTGQDDIPPLVDNAREIFVQRLSAAGAELGNDDFRVSSMGPDGSTLFAAAGASAAFNVTAGEYLVAWSGDDGTAPLVDNEQEVFVQRLAQDGTPVGGDTRLSIMGPDGNADFDALSAAAASSTREAAYVVAWQGDDVGGLLGNNEIEVYARRLAAVPAAPPPPPEAPAVTLTSASIAGSYRGRAFTGNLKVAGRASQAVGARVELTERGRSRVELSRTVSLPAGTFSLSLRLPTRLLPGAYSVRVTPTGGATATRSVTIASPRRGIVASASASSIRGGPPATSIPRRLNRLFFRFKFLVLPKTGAPIAVRILLPNGRPTGRRPIGKPRARVIDAFVASPTGLPRGRWRALLLVDGKTVSRVSVRIG